MANGKTVAQLKKETELQKAKDHEMVKGIFHFHEVPGGILEFMYKMYKGDPFEKYELKDGESYTIPYGVARHLNNDCWYPVHEYMKDEDGTPTQRVGQKVKRCSFQSIDFTELEQVHPEKEIITVEDIK